MFAGKKAGISKFNTKCLNAIEMEENGGQGNAISLFVFRSYLK